MIATAYLLFAISAGNLPVLTGLAAYDSKEACDAAATTMNAELAKGEDPEKIVCLSATSLNDLGKTNGLGGQ